jgi:ribosome-associated protein
MIQIMPTISIDERELHLEFVRASGPGGQKVNKVATAVQLRFDVINSPSLPDNVRTRLIRIAGKRMTEEGVLVIEAKRYRTQDRNRKDAIDRLISLIQKAALQPKPRRKTKPTRASIERRLENKRRRSETKRRRRELPSSEE